MAYSNISALFKGICDAIRSKDGTSAKINHQDIPSRIQGLNVTETVRLQQKSVTPSENAQTVKADTGYTALSQVNVGAIPYQYIIPSGTKDITQNCTTDVSEYASVNVNVPSGSGGGSTPQIKTGSFTTDNSAMADIQIGFAPDIFVIRNPFGTFTDDYDGVNVSDICVMFEQANEETCRLGLLETDDGAYEAYIFLDGTSLNVELSFKGWNWNWSWANVVNKSFDYVAIKYT